MSLSKLRELSEPHFSHLLNRSKYTHLIDVRIIEIEHKALGLCKGSVNNGVDSDDEAKGRF